MLMKAIQGINLPYPPNADKETKKGYKNVRSRAGQNLLYLAGHCPNSIYPGFEELWNYYFSTVDSFDAKARATFVLLQILYIVKYSLMRFGIMVVIVQMMQGIPMFENRDLIR